MSESLKGKTIIVTGATGTFGRAFVPMLLATGAVVSAWYRSDEEFAELTDRVPAEHRDRFHGQKLDLLDRAAVKKAVDVVIKHHKKIDGLVNAAGGWASVPFAEMTFEQWSGMLNLNLQTVWNVTHEALPHMAEAGYGRIVSFGAMAAMQARKDTAHYNVSKVGVAWLMESIANEYRGTDITANSVLPVSIANPGEKGTPPEKIIPAILYLLSPESAATSGGKIPV